MKTVFNSQGVANVRDMSEQVQQSYKGCGRGTVAIKAGEVVALLYSGQLEPHEVEARREQLKQLHAEGCSFEPCYFSSGQVILD